jgi:hypothetical protein
LGDAVVGGLVVSQALTLFTMPVTYLYMERLGDSLSGFSHRGRRSSERAVVAAGNHPRPTIIRHEPAE